MGLITMECNCPEIRTGTVKLSVGPHKKSNGKGYRGFTVTLKLTIVGPN